MTALRRDRRITCVDRSHALRELPTLHAVALRLRDNGFDDHVVAVVLDIEDIQVPTLLRVAEAKLARLVAGDPGAVDRKQRI
jgi:hypothetical protein